MWHKNIAGASSAIWWKGYKLILGPKRVLEGIYDMRKDSTETTNIAGVETKKLSSSLSSVSSSAGLTSATVSSAVDNARPLMSNQLQEKMQLKLASFDKFGHKAHAAHVLSKVNVSCFPPVASTVGPLPWDAAPLTVPDY
jgi:nucleoid DNA-binding protein